MSQPPPFPPPPPPQVPPQVPPRPGRLPVVALGLGLGSLALCQPLGLAAVVVGVVAVRRSNATPGRPQRGLAIGGIATGVLAVLMAVAVAWFYVAAVANTSTKVRVEDSTAGVSPCEPARVLSDPAC